MTPHALLRWFALSFLTVGVALAQSDVRFSNTLKPEEKEACGLTRLTSDEVAVIDALVRRDTASKLTSAPASGDSAPFTHRMSESERAAAGLKKLEEKEVTELDTLITRFQSAKLARSLLAPPTFVSRAPRRLVATEDTKKEREIHGSFSLSYGFGSGGYSEKTGSIMLTMDDPAKRYSISIGYTESHIKGGHPYLYDPFYGRDPFYLHRDPFYSPLRALPEEPLSER